MSIDSKFSWVSWRLLAVTLALPLGACLEPQSSEPRVERTCTACHGDERRAGDDVAKSAPPRDLDGHTEERFPGVGAHARHASGAGHAAVPCVTCHRVPEKVFSPGHVDSSGPAEVVLAGLAVASPNSNRVAKYDSNTGNCTDTYCHRDANVQWTSARNEAETCGTCHGMPPALPHPQSENCSSCHGEVIGIGGKWIAPSRHVDGKVDVAFATQCNACHGANASTGAPPPDLGGSTSPASKGVGAHANHLESSETHRPIACSECHRVPTEVGAETHIDGDNRAEIVFGALATTSGVLPTYDASTLTCKNTYCHGTSTADWQAPRGSTEACGSCHGLPPPPPHTQSQQCANCHGRVVGPDGRIIEPELHLDGIVEVDFTNGCSGCHGTGANGAPPPDLKGQSATTARGVGAHALHSTAGSTHGAIACGECHRVPSTVADPAHLDGDAVAEVSFGPLASAEGHSPLYDHATAGCSDTYCHRGSAPIWQAPRSSAAACGSCHLVPPPAPHPVASECSQCHGAVIDASRRFVAPERHVDGKVDLGPIQCNGCHGLPPNAPHPATTDCARCHSAVVNANREIIAQDLHANGRVDLDPMPCNACHGTDKNGAPPPDTSGLSSSDARGVGAHTRHVFATLTHAAFACNECHVVPTAWNSLGHMDSPLPAEVTFGALAKVNGMAPRYSSATGTCTNTYCHGMAAAPTWTAQPLGSCDSCHGMPPALPHPQRAACVECHGSVVDAGRNFVSPELHVDGQVQVVQNCTACHGSANNPAPPFDISGGSDPTRIGVGAHQIHSSGGNFGRQVACNECHVVPVSITAPGHLDVGAASPADVTFLGPALANGQNATWDRSIVTCQGSWCHGPKDPFNRSPRWTGITGTSSCNSCHGMPPAAPHPADAGCSRCHLGVDAQNAIVDRSLHVNGEVDLR